MSTFTFLKASGSNSLLEILVIPNARKTEIVGIHDGRLKLKVNAPPVDGKANDNIILFFAELFGIAKSKIAVAKGELNKRKTLAIQNLNLEEANQILNEAIRSV